jgi:hypothetical protein
MAYVDFAINDTGDLLFAKRDDKYTSLSIKFNISKTKVQKISFLTEESDSTIHHSDNYLKVIFNIENIANKTTAIVCKDNNSIVQLISIVLNESVGELAFRKKEGSELSVFKHKNIDKKTLSNLETYLESFLKDYLNNPSVSAKANINYSNGYKQVIDLYIYNDNDLLLKYTLES